MKTYFFVLCMLFCSSEMQAQIPNPPVVALDKMNVLYYGIDNPITIGSPVDLSQVKISISNGTMTGEGIHRIVSPESTEKNTVITIDVNGKKTSHEFRVKRIPDPVFKIGSGKKRMAVAEFKNQSFCRAELENFDFLLRFNIVSATVYFSGKGFDEVVQTTLKGNNLSPLSAQTSRCQPGSQITFTDIAVQGPDGIRMINEQSYLLY